MATSTEAFQANLDRIVAPLMESADRRMAYKVDDIERARRLKDVADERAYQDGRIAKQEQRVIDRERRQKILALASQGIELPENATDADIAKASLNQRKKRAELVIGSHESDLAANDSEYQNAYKDLLSLSTGSATQEEMQVALNAMLSNQDIRSTLSAKQIKKLNDSLSVKGGPLKAVQEVAAEVGGDYWFFPGKNPAKAQAIIDAFNAPLLESAATTKQIKYKALTDKLNDISEERKVIQRSLSQSYRDNAEFLDASALKRGQKLGAVPVADESFGPPSPSGGVLPDPNDAFPSDSPPAKSATQPVESKPSGFIPSAVKQMGDEMAVDGAYGTKIRPGEIAGRFADIGLAGVGDVFTTVPKNIYRSAWSGEPQIPSSAGVIAGAKMDSQYAQPISEAEESVGRAARDARLGPEAVARIKAERAARLSPPKIENSVAQRMVANPDEQPYPLTPEAMQAVTNLVVTKYKGKMSEAAAFFQKVKAGAREAIATYNTLYEEARNQISPPQVQTPGLAPLPVHDEGLAPLPQ